MFVENCVYRAGPIRTQYARFDSMLPSAPRSALITNKDRGPCIWIATCASSCAACALCCALAKAIIGIRWTLFISEWLFTISTFHVVGKRFPVLAVQYHKYNGYFTHQSFKAVSLIRHIVTKHTVALPTNHKVSLDNPKWFKTDCVDFHSEHTCLDILLLYMFRLPPYEYNGHTQITE